MLVGKAWYIPTFSYHLYIIFAANNASKTDKKALWYWCLPLTNSGAIY